MSQNSVICIIEDFPDINEILEDNLRRENYRTRTFQDGEKAYNAIFADLAGFCGQCIL